MALGQIVELCVSVVTIVNYCAQCELLIFYLREIGLRMEEKTKDLSIIMKVIILDICFCNYCHTKMGFNKFIDNNKHGT